MQNEKQQSEIIHHTKSEAIILFAPYFTETSWMFLYQRFLSITSSREKEM